jgi:hypothetical protein
MHEYPTQPGFFQSLATLGLVGALVYGAYRVNGEMQPLVDTWHEIVHDFDGISGAEYYFETNHNYSIEVGSAAFGCLEGQQGGVARVNANPAEQHYDVYVRRTGQTVLNLSGVDACIVKTTGADITVRVVAVR